MGARIRLVVLAVCFMAISSVSSAETAGAIFNAGASARPLGMGSAFTAVTQDASALYYNPAGLGLIQGRQISLMQASLYGGAAYQYMSYGQGFRKSPAGWGLEILKLGVSGIDGKDEMNKSMGALTYSETGFGFGMGYRGLIVPELSFGWRIKMLKRQMPGASDQLSGADVGFRYGPFWGERMNLGVVVQNAVSYAKGDTADKLPLQVKLGSSYKVAGPLLLALDMGSNGDINIGTEYALGSFAALRAGIQNFGGFSFGIGLMFRQSMALDLAVVQSPVLGTSQRLSMSYRFGSRPQQGAPARNVEFAAKEYFDNAMGELDRHHYLDASRSLDMALSLDARLGDNGWKSKAKRLKELTLALGLAERNDLVSAYSEETTQSNEAHQAVLALLDSDDELAMLLAHASYGIDTKDIAFRDLLNTFAALTHRNVIRDDIMAPDLLVEKRLVDLSRLVYHRDYENAIRAGRQAVMLNPNHAMAWTRLGSAYFASGNKSEAVAAWRRALDLEPNNEPLRQFMKAQGL